MTNHREETTPGHIEPLPDAPRSQLFGETFYRPVRSLAQRDWQQLREEMERAGRLHETKPIH